MLQIFELIRQINSLLFRAMVPIVKAEGLARTELMILWKVYNRGTYRATDLAREVDVPPSTFTGIFDRLVAKDYLVRVNDPDDRRSVLVQGTEELNRLVERIMSQVEVRLKEIFHDMPDEMLGHIMEDLNEMCRYLRQNI